MTAKANVVCEHKRSSRIWPFTFEGSTTGNDAAIGEGHILRVIRMESPTRALDGGA